MNYTEKILHQSNYWYNDGLRKAQIRDMSGAITSLRKSLQYNRANIDARNLLGLVYYGRYSSRTNTKRRYLWSGMCIRIFLFLIGGKNGKY